MIGTFLLTQWKLVALAAAIVILGGSTFWYRSSALSARQDVVELRHRNEVMARSLEAQNEAVLDFKKKAEIAQKRAAKLQAEAATKSAAARKSADALAKALAGPRPVDSVCPAGGAMEVVREDLRSAIR